MPVPRGKFVAVSVSMNLSFDRPSSAVFMRDYGVLPVGYLCVRQYEVVCPRTCRAGIR
jgi:hypothetical protein